MQFTIITRTARLLALAALLAAPLGFDSVAMAADPLTRPPIAAENAVKLPKTAEEHLAKADEYKTKAAAYRAEAAAHRKMLADYLAQAQVERPDEGPDRKAMRIHCEAYINKNDALANEAENFSAFHSMWANELRNPSSAPLSSTPAQIPALSIKQAVTPQENLTRAAEYQKKAAAAREEAAAHRKMLEEYKRWFPATEGQLAEDPYVRKMRLHCEGFVAKAEALAAEAERFADFHRARAADLQGK